MALHRGRLIDDVRRRHGSDDGVRGDHRGRRRYALGRGYEVFGHVPVVAIGVLAIGGAGHGDVAPGNVVVGARHVTERRASPKRIAIAPSLWSWLPTASAEDFELELADLFGLEDARAYLPTLALGGSLAVSGSPAHLHKNPTERH